MSPAPTTSPAPTPAPTPAADARRPPRRAIAAAAAVAGVLTTLLLSLGHQDVGYVRDEGIYFAASRSYAGWAIRLAQAPGEAMSARERDRAFAINREHPPLMKLAGGLAAALLAEPSAPAASAERGADPPTRGLLPLLREGAAMRLPAQLLAGLGVALLVVAGASLGGGLLAGLLAAGWFILLPRVWFHAGLHCFDVPVAVAGLALALAYRAALRSRGWALALGPLLGVAITIKHNALFLPALFAVHYLVCLARSGAWRRARLWLPLGLWSMALLGPLTAFALWPWLWSAPIDRLAAYVAFHSEHAYYNTEFLGTNYNQPPLPIAYPFVLTWATVPSALLVLALVGLAIGLWRDMSKRTDKIEPAEGPAEPPSPRRWSAPLRADERHDGVLLALLALFPLALIAAPNVPIFGGTKHWLTAYPFLALAAALAWGALWRLAGLAGRWRQAPALALVLLLVPAGWSTYHAHPQALSQYAPLVGGARGAAELGLMRGFWGASVTPLLPAMGRLGERRLDLHDLHELARRQYAREGRWPPGLQPSPTARASAGLHFYERHMLTYEVQLWNALGVAAPAAVVELDDVPLASLYDGAP